MCTVCDAYVQPSAKHCQRCNRCCYEFDHHCLWVNNDIGLHNYADFLRMLLFLLATLIVQLGFTGYTMWLVPPDSALGEEISLSFGRFKRQSLTILSAVTIFVSGALLILDLYLLCYHLKLICRNTTTYRYIREKQNLANKKSRIIKEVAGAPPPEDSEGIESNNEDELNANSIIQESIMSISEVQKKKAKKTRRVTCIEVFCCREKNNVLRKRVLSKT